MNPNIDLNGTLLMYYGIDFAIAIVLLAGVRYFAGVISNVSAAEELAQKDNPAFGLAMAGAIIAVAVMLIGALSGDFSNSHGKELMLMASYGVAGIILMWVTRIVFDRFSLPQISVHQQIMSGNVATGIVDAGNMIATAIIIRAVMDWVDLVSLNGIFIVIGGYIISQIIMLLATIYRSNVFSKRHPGKTLHDAIASGNTALAIRFAGHRLGIALAVSAATGLVPYIEGLEIKQLLTWGVIAIIMFVLLNGIAILMRKIVLYAVDVADEVDKQRNIAIGSIEASIYLAVGFILLGLFG